MKYRYNHTGEPKKVLQSKVISILSEHGVDTSFCEIRDFCKFQSLGTSVEIDVKAEEIKIAAYGLFAKEAIATTQMALRSLLTTRGTVVYQNI